MRSTPDPMTAAPIASDVASQRVWVVGAGGRIGGLLGQMTRARWAPVGLWRDDVAAALGQPGLSAPIVVCTRNDDLDSVLNDVHPSRHADLVFVQNGLFQPALEARSLGACTQGVLYVAVTAPGGAPVPGGPSVFCGPWASCIAEMMHAHGVEAIAVDRSALHREIAVKLAWICCVGLLGERTQGTVASVLGGSTSELRSLCDELHPALCRGLKLDLSATALWDRVVAYSLRVPHFPARLKERRWRNDAVVAMAGTIGIHLPLHRALLSAQDG